MVMLMEQTNIVENATTLFCEILEDNYWNYDEEIIAKIVRDSYARKQGLRDIFSKHPNWSEDDDSIILMPSDDRPKLDGRISQFTDFLLGNTAKEDADKLQVWSVFYKAIKDGLTTITEPVRDQLADIGYRTFNNKKLSRAINEWANAAGYARRNGFNKEYAQLSDAINHQCIEHQMIISINPCAILTMANHEDGSCHWIDKRQDRCHKAGPLSYILDSPSFIVYFVNKDEDCIFTETKLRRQMFFYEQGLLIQSRLYPWHKEVDVCNCFRTTVQAVIAHGLDRVNYWTLVTNGVRIADAVKDAEGSTHYNDATRLEDDEKSRFNCTMSLLKGMMTPSEIVVGSPSVCINCGTEITNSEWLTCCDTNKLIICACCGCDMEEEEDTIEVDSEYYCTDCAFHCWDCGGILFRSDEYYTDDSGYKYCEDCYDSRYTRCDRCNAEIERDDAIPCHTYDNMEDWCQSCVDDDATLCSCGTYCYGELCCAEEEDDDDDDDE